MWETLQTSLNQIRRQAETSKAAWGVAIGAIAAFLTEGVRFAQNQVNSLKNRLDQDEANIATLQQQVNNLQTPPAQTTQPTAPPVQAVPPTVSAQGATASVSTDPTVNNTYNRVRVIVTTNGSGGNGTNLCTVNFGATFAKPPIVLVNPVGPTTSTGNVTPFSVYAGLSTQVGVALYSDSVVSGQTRSFDVVMLSSP